ncbi:hypothetical protein [Paludisphaera sp.]|uniref:hypothetical protein n=1 Tax=Paludisphaera sp. TaxID=2017432 RepID=UPI00301C8C10
MTVFTTVNLMPLYPRESFYVKPQAPRAWACEPVLFRDDGKVLQALPLTSIDRASVIMAYMRGLFALLTLSGVLLLVPAIHSLMGEPLDDLGRIATRVMSASALIGIVGGCLSYAVPLLTERERRIRRSCGECLGLAVDPARLWGDQAEKIVDILSAGPEPRDSTRHRLIRDLTRTRARLAYAAEVAALEARTDRLLEELEFLDRLDV